MSRTRQWMITCGGVLTLLAVIGFYMIVVRDNGPYDRGLQGWPQWLLSIFRSWFWLLVFGVVLTALGNGSRPIGHWYQLIDGLKVEPSAIYQSVSDQVKERKIPGHALSMTEDRVRGIVSVKRKHLRISRGEHRFDLCAFPFGKDYGISWRCYEHMGLRERMLTSIPIVGWGIYLVFFRYTTHFEDRGLMFQTSIHRCVRETVENVLNEQGLRALTEAEYQPALANMFKRWG